MGLTLIRKSDGSAPEAATRRSRSCSPAARSRAARSRSAASRRSNDFLVDRKITDIDIYVGLSAGAILGASLAAGITPDEMIKVLDGTSTRLDQLRPFDFYNPNCASSRRGPASSPTTC